MSAIEAVSPGNVSYARALGGAPSQAAKEAGDSAAGGVPPPRRPARRRRPLRRRHRGRGTTPPDAGRRLPGLRPCAARSWPARTAPPATPARPRLAHRPQRRHRAFLKGHRGSAVSVALLRAGQPVLGVVFAYAAPDGDGDLFAWAEGCGPVTRNGRPVAPPAWPTELSAAQTVLVSQDADKNSEANAEVVGPGPVPGRAEHRLPAGPGGGGGGGRRPSRSTAPATGTTPPATPCSAGRAANCSTPADRRSRTLPKATAAAATASAAPRPSLPSWPRRDWSAVFEPPAPSLQPSSRLPFDLARPVAARRSPTRACCPAPRAACSASSPATRWAAWSSSRAPRGSPSEHPDGCRT